MTSCGDARIHGTAILHDTKREVTCREVMPRRQMRVSDALKCSYVPLAALGNECPSADNESRDVPFLAYYRHARETMDFRDVSSHPCVCWGASVDLAAALWQLAFGGCDRTHKPQVAKCIRSIPPKHVTSASRLCRECRHLRGGNLAEFTQDTPTSVSNAHSEIPDVIISAARAATR